MGAQVRMTKKEAQERGFIPPDPVPPPKPAPAPKPLARPRPVDNKFGIIVGLLFAWFLGFLCAAIVWRCN